MLDRLRQPVYGADDGAACATFCSRGWKQTFLVAAEAGAPAIGDSKAGGGAAALYLGAGPCRFQMTPSLQVSVTPSADNRPVLWKQATPSAPISFP